LKNRRGCFNKPRFGISCKFEGKKSLKYNACPSINFEPNGVVQLAKGVGCDFIPTYKFISAFSDINLPGVHKD
jgi:hypothetical protein